VLAFVLIGLASEQATSTAAETGNKSTLFLALIVGLIVLCIGVVLVAPTCLALLARAARPASIVVRLALRDLARYRARSGAALGAISLSVLIAVIICVTAAARFGNAVDYVGPNPASNQLVVYPAVGHAQFAAPSGTHQRQAAPTPDASVLFRSGSRSIPIVVTGAQLAAMAAEARGIAGSLGSRDIVQLETTDSFLQRRVRADLGRGCVRRHAAAAARVRHHRRARQPGRRHPHHAPRPVEHDEDAVPLRRSQRRPSGQQLALPADLLPGESEDRGGQRVAVRYVGAEHRESPSTPCASST